MTVHQIEMIQENNYVNYLQQSKSTDV